MVLTSLLVQFEYEMSSVLQPSSSFDCLTDNGCCPVDMFTRNVAVAVNGYVSMPANTFKTVSTSLTTRV